MKKTVFAILMIIAMICSIIMFCVACEVNDGNGEKDNSSIGGNETNNNAGSNSNNNSSIGENGTESGNESNKNDNDSESVNKPNNGNDNNSSNGENDIFLTNKGEIVGITNYGKTLNEIVVPSQIGQEKITGIGSNAFNGCNILAKIEIPSCVVNIRENAFEGCGSLTVYFEENDLPSGWASLYWNIKENCAVPIVVDYRHNEIADDGNIYFVDGGMRYALKDGKATVAGCLGSGSLEIPNKIIYKNANYEVVKIGDYAFYENGRVKEIDIPNSIKDIGLKAFYSCGRLENIKIPKSITYIESETFAECNALKYIAFDHDCELTIIGDKAFSYCNKLETINIPKSVKSISSYAFSNCNSLRNITFEDCSELTSIYDHAFYSCKSLEQLQIPDSVTRIDNLAFAQCNKLSVLTFGESSNLSSIGVGAFRDCTNLFELTMPATISNIPSDVFSECSNIRRVTIPINVLNVIPKSKLCEIVINGGEKIESNAFADCTSLTSIEIPFDFTNIADNAFNGCKITSATIPTTAIKAIPKDYLKRVVLNGGEMNPYNESDLWYVEESFSNCTTLEEAVICSKVHNIGLHAFEGCDNLTKVDIEIGVEYIEDSAFAGCRNLETILLPASVFSVGEDAFSNCGKLTKIYCEFKENESIKSRLEDENCISREIVWEYNNIKTNEEYDYVLRGEMAYLTSYKGSGTNINIPEYIDGNLVVYFGSIFNSNETIKSVKISKGIIRIGCWAFAICSNLESVFFEEYGNLTSIGETAFAMCKKLDNVVLPNTVTSIEDNAFHFCEGLCEITLSSKLKSIGQGAFSYTVNLTSIVIPKSVTQIKSYAFVGSANLTKINCEVAKKPSGWESDWNLIMQDKTCPAVWGYIV